MDSSQWHDRWQEGRIGFHQDDINPFLIEHFTWNRPLEVCVPLCGKSLDLKWLADQGHRVTGIELSAIACRAFFSENNIPFTVAKRGAFEVFTSDKITLWCGDFLLLPVDQIPKFEFIYDRAALIALPKTMRQAYSQKILSLAPVGCEVLLLTIDYPQAEVEGPPFAVSDREIVELYSEQMHIERKLHQEAASMKQNHPKFKAISSITESLTHLKKLA